MKPIFYYTAAFFLTAALPAQAATYICRSEGRAVFTTEKLGPHCTLSQMNGISDQAASAADGEPITRLWEKEQFGAYDDIKILPTPKPSGVTNTADATSPSMRIKLRNAPKNSKAQSARPRTPAPVIAAPPARPQLSRKQILQNEIRNEQAALVREQAQLNVAKSKGDKAKVSRLEQAVRDRQANIRAIQGEMGR